MAPEVLMDDFGPIFKPKSIKYSKKRGTVGPWVRGTLGLWDCRSLGPWDRWTLGLWDPGTLVPETLIFHCT